MRQYVTVIDIPWLRSHPDYSLIFTNHSQGAARYGGILVEDDFGNRYTTYRYRTISMLDQLAATAIDPPHDNPFESIPE